MPKRLLRVTALPVTGLLAVRRQQLTSPPARSLSPSVQPSVEGPAALGRGEQAGPEKRQGAQADPEEEQGDPQPRTWVSSEMLTARPPSLACSWRWEKPSPSAAALSRLRLGPCTALRAASRPPGRRRTLRLL